MKLEDINFPVYRRYKNGRSYFKIINPNCFEEIQVIGTKRIIKVIEAKLFPEKSFIADLILNYQTMADEISEQEYLQRKGV